MKNWIYPLSKTIVYISAAFILLMSITLFIEFQKGAEVLPQTQSMLDSLRLEVENHAEWVPLVRDLDYLYRKSYFTHHAQVQNATRILVSALILFFLGIIAMTWSRPPAFVRPQNISREKEIVALRYGLLTLGLCAVLGLGSFAVYRLNLPSESSDSNEMQPPLSLEQIPAELPFDLAAFLSASAQHWPSFRGSITANANGLPQSANLQTLWKTKIPLHGYNSPVIWGDKIFVSGANKKKNVVYCYDLSTGKLIWKKETPPFDSAPDVTDDTGYAAPTLTVDQDRVYAIFATGQLIAINHAGEMVWHKKFPAPHIHYGYASSLLHLGDRIIVQYDMEDQQTLYALSPTTGNELWKTTRPSAVSWATPAAIFVDSHPYIFTAGNQKAELFDANTGKLIWGLDCMGGEVATTAVAYDNKIYYANQGAFTGAFEPLTGKIIWQNDNVPSPDVSSPMVANNAMYLCGSGGSIIVLNAETGEEAYEENLDNGFYGSPVMIDQKLLMINQDGLLLVVNPNVEKFEVVRRHEIGEKVVATPAVVGKKIIVRTFNNELMCLGEAQ